MKLALILSVGLFLSWRIWADEIAVFYALERDWDQIKAQAQSVNGATKVGNRSIETVRLGAHQVYGVKMGAGVVESAISAQALLSRFRCDLAISLGPIGALLDDLKVGQWCLVTNVVAYQKGTQTGSAFQRGERAEFVLPFPSWVKEMVLENELKKITVASGEAFIASERFRNELRDSTQAQAVDMNLFGLLSVLESYAVPHVALRVVSDKADDAASEDFKKFVERYKGEGGDRVVQLITNLPPNPNSPDSYPSLKKLLNAK
ncbi:MAG: 5'-methylthioadenosine/S-adenosylhomocysteine nucleosidase [Verrucomicrobiae bacterium]|nr:5'-methylthioadenosine/S-adenosylhomocysteine nucleosidase [Verrucomicrobiae bacterium]